MKDAPYSITGVVLLLLLVSEAKQVGGQEVGDHSRASNGRF